MFIFITYSRPAAAQDQKEENQIISAAESLFVAMKGKNYPEIWRLITRKSQEEISSNIVKAARKQGEELNHVQVAKDFAEGGPIARAYWNAYLDAFNPDLVLKECSWRMGEVKKKEAIIILQHKKAERPALLQMKKEDNVWKVGLEETFGILRWLIK